MAEQLKVGCARPTGGPVGETVPEQLPERNDEKKGGPEHDSSR